MAIYSFWIFDRHCNCVFSREWEPKIASGGSKLFNYPSFTSSSSTTTLTSGVGSVTGSAGASASANAGAASTNNQLSSGLINVNNVNDNAKLLLGSIISLRNIASKLYGGNGNSGNSPSDYENPDASPIAVSNYLTTFSTNNYRVHYFETATSWRFALVSDAKLEDLQFALQYIYTTIFNEFVVKNALSQVDFLEGEYISNQAFVNRVDAYITSLPSFTS